MHHLSAGLGQRSVGTAGTSAHLGEQMILGTEMRLRPCVELLERGDIAPDTDRFEEERPESVDA